MTDELHGLVDRCLAGDQLAIADLVYRYQGQVFGLCYRMLGNRQDAEDMTQECFVRVVRSLHRWDQQRRFEPWLLTIAGNRCRSLLATKMRRPETTHLTEHLPDRSGEEQAARTLAEEVDLALGRLRVEYRQAFVYFHENEMSYAEIGRAMECPLGTVKTWVHRARRELIDHLRQRGVVEEPSRGARHAMRKI